MNAPVISAVIAVIAVFATSCGSMQTPAPAPSAQAVPGAAARADTQAPKVSMMMFPQTLREEGNVFFQLSTRDDVNVAEVVLTIDGKAFVKDGTAYNSYAKYFTAQDNGAHTVTVQVYDSANNVTEYREDFRVDIAR